MYSSLLLPHIFSPTRTTSSSATLIDKIFTNNYNSSFVSGNLNNTLSDHHAQILIMENNTGHLNLITKSIYSESSKRLEKQKYNTFSTSKCGLGIGAAFESQWCQFIIWTISQKSGKMIKFLGTSPKNIKQPEKTIKQTMAN